MLYFLLQHKIQATRPKSSLKIGAQLVVSSGVDLQGDTWKSQQAPCTILRITDDECVFCKRDSVSYERIVDAARRSSCDVIEIAPVAQGMAYAPRPGVTQLQFVDRDVVTALYPFVTPQTIILDNHWVVRMTKRGVFDDDSLAEGLSVIASLKRPLPH